jgi:hypothetical protein
MGMAGESKGQVTEAMMRRGGIPTRANVPSLRTLRWTLLFVTYALVDVLS